MLTDYTARINKEILKHNYIITCLKKYYLSWRLKYINNKSDCEMALSTEYFNDYLATVY